MFCFGDILNCIAGPAGATNPCVFEYCSVYFVGYVVSPGDMFSEKGWQTNPPNYKHPKIPQNSEKGILKGMYFLKEFNHGGKIKIQLLGCGTILREIIAAGEVLSKEYNIDSDIWSVTSFNELRKDGMETERKNLLNPGVKPEKSYVERCLEKREGPIIAASDYVRTFADQIRPYLSKPFYSLGTDGYGRSDGRKQLRKFFGVDKEYIVTYALSALAKEQLIPSNYAEKAMKKYNIDKNKPIPTEL